ncbi:AI-2E family transporter [Haloferula chungangensis]|uniref:AI-2E family transporter n=1 Tax=Haloferula chungangensis TaxID=1048331 RepID=A0ABW2LBD3_9BACT
MNSSEPHVHPLRNTAVTFAAIGVILALLRQSADIVQPVLLSLLIVTIASPPLQWLRKLGVSTGASVLLGIIVVIVVLSASSVLLSAALNRFSEALPLYHDQLVEHSDRLDVWLAAKGIDPHKGGVLHHFTPERINHLTESAITHMGSAVSNALLVLFVVIFMLAEATHFSRKLAKVMGTGGAAAPALAHLLRDIHLYITTKAVVSALTGILIWIGLSIFGLEYAGLWGFLAFMFNFIPSFGSIVAAVPPVLLALLHGSPIYAGGVVLLFLAVNILIGNMLEPIVVGRALGLSAVTVLLSLVFWGWMFGVVGMLVSVPLSMAVRAFADAYPPTRWLAVLMGPALEDPEITGGKVASGPD